MRESQDHYQINRKPTSKNKDEYFKKQHANLPRNANI